jgi:hypothetical protein
MFASLVEALVKDDDRLEVGMRVDFPGTVLSHLIRRRLYLIAINIPPQLEAGYSEPRRSLLKRSAFLTRTGVALLLPGPCRFVASCYPSKLGKNTSERNPN